MSSIVKATTRVCLGGNDKESKSFSFSIHQGHYTKPLHMLESQKARCPWQSSKVAVLCLCSFCCFFSYSLRLTVLLPYFTKYFLLPQQL